MSATVRPIERRDIPAVIELIRLHAAYEKLPFVEREQATGLASAFFDAQPCLYGWVVDDGGGALLGYMTVVVDFATWAARPFAYMDCLFLRDHARGRGLGRRLIDELRNFMRQHDCETAEWHTPPHNELGISFYRRIGARELVKVRFFLELDSPEVRNS